jgi:hypothetical protein
MTAFDTQASGRLLTALGRHARQGCLYAITLEDVSVFLQENPALAELLDGLDPEALAVEIYDAIGEIGILELVEQAIREAVSGSLPQPDCPLDGDPASALASIGWGTDEDYFFFRSFDDD